MNFFDHRDLGNHLLQLCPKVVKHPVYNRTFLYEYHVGFITITAVQSCRQYAKQHSRTRWLGRGGAQTGPQWSTDLIALDKHLRGDMKDMAYARKVNTREKKYFGKLSALQKMRK